MKFGFSTIGISCESQRWKVTTPRVSGRIIHVSFMKFCVCKYLFSLYLICMLYFIFLITYIKKLHYQCESHIYSVSVFDYKIMWIFWLELQDLKPWNVWYRGVLCHHQPTPDGCPSGGDLCAKAVCRGKTLLLSHR